MPTHHSQSHSPHLHSPLEQHAPLVPLSCPATAKGTTNKSHHSQKAPKTKTTTRSGLPITVRVGIPICIHHLSNMRSCAFVLSCHRKRHHKQKPPHAKGTTNQSHHTFRPTHHTQSSGLPITVKVGVPICIHHLSNRHLLCLCLAQPPQKAPKTKLTNHHKQT